MVKVTEIMTAENLINLILLFFAYAFLGWCIEVTLKYFQLHRFINRCFLTGPWLPIYGSGAALITIAVSGLAPLESSVGTTFVISFILCGIVEYMTSFVLEKRFHARWWDYSQKPMNLNGRVWIGNLILFGLGGVLIVELFNPLLFRLFGHMTFRLQEILALVLSCVFAADYVMSHFVLKLVKAGVESSEADDTEAINKEVHLLLHDRSFFHRRFAEAYPEVIYKTERITARMEAIKAETERLRMEAERRHHLTIFLVEELDNGGHQGLFLFELGAVVVADDVVHRGLFDGAVKSGEVEKAFVVLGIAGLLLLG